MIPARLGAVALLVIAPAACALPGASPVGVRSTTSVTTADRFESQTSVAAADGGAWEFVEGLRIRITGATRLDSSLGAHSRGDARLALLRVDFSYTNNGTAVHRSEGLQLPVRLLYGPAGDEAVVDPGYVGTSGQLTLSVPTSVPPGAAVLGAVSFVVPEVATGELAILVVEPRRYTEHLFTDVQHLLERVPPG